MSSFHMTLFSQTLLGYKGAFFFFDNQKLLFLTKNGKTWTQNLIEIERKRKNIYYVLYVVEIKCVTREFIIGSHLNDDMKNDKSIYFS